MISVRSYRDFGIEEEVKLEPNIFMAMCYNLMVTPSVDLFASAKHHQLSRYFTIDEQDSKALGYNAFAFVWSPDICLYANQPWSIIAHVLVKASRERARLMLVTPQWPETPWYHLLKEFTVRSEEWSGRIYLDERGRLRPRPKWITLFSYVVGRPLNGVLRRFSI